MDQTHILKSPVRTHFLLPLVFMLCACQPRESAKNDCATPAKPDATPDITSSTKPGDVKSSVVRINSTQQSWNPWQPWEKNPPRKRRALAAIIGPQRVLTTAELVADATYLEFESADGTRFSAAKVIAVDYEANLALLEPTFPKEGDYLFAHTVPLKITTPPIIGDTLEILQLEDNGLTLLTPGTLQSVDLASNFLPDHSFLTYMVKASMQSAAGSYSLPVLHSGMLAGVLLNYNEKDQLCDVTSTDIVKRFLEAAATGAYKGFPSLGIAIARTEDASFRQWLKLSDDQGGIFIQRVRKGGAAEVGGVKPGDVLLAVDGKAIDRRGYYTHPNYGSLLWGHLIRGEKSTGDVVTLSVLRAGSLLELKLTLTREDASARLVPNPLFDKPPNYLLKGGMLFQELSLPMLESFGEDWQSRAPLNLLDAYKNPEKYEESVDRIVFLSGVIPTPATVGYERLRNLIVHQVNGHKIRNMKNLIAAFEDKRANLHSIEFTEENLTVYLDDSVTAAVDAQLLQRGISPLSRAE
jgi:S1-C subfamily serine protease